MTALFGPVTAIEQARAFREAGASGVFTFEGTHDVFAPLTLASTVGGLDLMTNVAIAFPRNPIHLAHQAIDHQIAQRGPVRAGPRHADPHPDREAVRCAVRQAGGPDDRADRGAAGDLRKPGTPASGSNFRGEYYRHTLMTPNFIPGDNPYGPPPIYVGALGPRLTRATAEHADGLLVMPFGNKRFLHEVTMPAVREGLAAAGNATRRATTSR